MKLLKLSKRKKMYSSKRTGNRVNWDEKDVWYHEITKKACDMRT